MSEPLNMGYTTQAIQKCIRCGKLYQDPLYMSCPVCRGFEELEERVEKLEALIQELTNLSRDEAYTKEINRP